jgi:hypothetical protein
MGWFESGTKPGVMLGDEPFDLAYEFLKNLSEAYREELGRGPTLDEVCALFETSLRVNARDLLHEFEDRAVTQLAIKTVAKKKAQRFAAGDWFAVPLGEGRFAFGRVIELDKSLGALVEIFRGVGQAFPETADADAAGRLFHPIYVVPDALEDWRWTVLSSDENYRPTDLKQLEFATGDSEFGWTATKGEKTRKVSDREAETLEPLRLWWPEDVEDRIREEAM